MSNVEKISVALTAEMAIMLKETVSFGAYASSSELIREWRERREYRAKASERLGQLWDVGVMSGEAVDGPDAMAQIQDKLAKTTVSKTAA
ncbi:MAG: hypothetical protein RL230_979 [Pseudomonadota bacterium]